MAIRIKGPHDLHMTIDSTAESVLGMLSSDEVGTVEIPASNGYETLVVATPLTGWLVVIDDDRRPPVI